MPKPQGKHRGYSASGGENEFLHEKQNTATLFPQRFHISSLSAKASTKSARPG